MGPISAANRIDDRAGALMAYRPHTCMSGTAIRRTVSVSFYDHTDSYTS